MIRYVRYAFANLPAYIGRVFFSKEVSLPFLRFRMLRHGIIRSPIPWREIERVSQPHPSDHPDTKPPQDGLKGLWITTDESRQPDIVIYYCHGTSPSAPTHPSRPTHPSPPQAAASPWARATSTWNSCSHG